MTRSGIYLSLGEAIARKTRRRSNFMDFNGKSQKILPRDPSNRCRTNYRECLLVLEKWEWIFRTHPLYIFNASVNSHLILILNFICTFTRLYHDMRWESDRHNVERENELKNVGICDIYVTENKLKHHTKLEINWLCLVFIRTDESESKIG